MKSPKEKDKIAASDGIDSHLRLFLIFFVKGCCIAVRPEQEAFCPRWGPAHLLTDRVQRHAGISLNDQFVVNVHHDVTAPERAHGVTENVACGGLHDVLHEFRTVGIQSLPFLRRTDAFVGDALAAELVGTDLVGVDPADLFFMHFFVPDPAGP